ncbi:MAG TPA: metalloregulator ArsR/SmtB family transcription factor [Casimicrobiaceae bacterium]|jgi:DNA-binding transcriptional ArsR family regulator|nr:metalloregulator ArsR/SmtB family transcription factor [Casimicrobiaceae bacterium]
MKPPRPHSPRPHSPRRRAAPGADGDELDRVFAVVAQHFALLAEPTRLKILHAICADERSVSAIVAATGATQTNVSRHLALMHRAGVVTRRRQGSAVYYRVDDPQFVEICRNVCVQIAGRLDERSSLSRGLLDFAHDH